ncbi:MAG TPA: HD domain-containing phosphohydrolase [Candidatus Dormibacteraeota bacterium]|jgi:PAS domain S-box-containing protein|nr:HD domain-containing phosphohydrolase [Candidatus Dormibacteraeota bacterium]
MPRALETSRDEPPLTIARPEIDYQLIAEAIPHIVWLATPDGSIEYVNRRASDYTGLSREVTYGWGWLSMVHPEDRARVQAAWERATRTETPYEIEYRLRRADATYRWFAFRSLPARDADGHTVRWIGTATDIQDAKRLKDELRRANRQNLETITLLETLQATAPLGLGFIDRDFRIVQLNDRLAAVTGGSAADHVGKKVPDVVPALWPTLEPLYRRVLKGEPILNREMSGPSAEDGGGRHSWLSSYYPVRVGDEVIGIGVVVVDITERKRAQQARDELTRSAVGAIVAIVEARDPYTAGHQRRVGELSAAIGAEMGLDQFAIEGIRLAGTIHDIGKIRTPAEILTRPGKLRPAEYELVKSHSRDGHDIVADIDFPWPVPQMILQHHERCDGSGYPDGLRRDEITLGARIIAVADVVDAMTLPRPYRVGLGLPAAIEELSNGRGSLFDPEAVDALLRLCKEGRVCFDRPSA